MEQSGKDILLKVALFRNGQPLQEALAKPGEGVTIGRAESCTLKLPGERVPDSFPIFLWDNNRAQLRFSEAMPGSVMLSDGETPLSALVEQGRTERVQGFHLFTLDGTERGSLKLGDLELRFEFAEHSPEETGRKEAPVRGPRDSLIEQAVGWVARSLGGRRDGRSPDEKKVLRVAVVRENQILEERLVRKPGDVTIGTSDRTTLKLPMSNAPESFRLFEYSHGRYHLRFSAGMTGKIALKDEVVDLEAVRGTKRVEKKGKCYQLALTDQDRGKVSLGDVSLLFQFVIPPRPVAAEELKAVRSGFGDAFERVRIWASVSTTGRQSRSVMVGLMIALLGAFAVGTGTLLLPWLEENTVQFERMDLFFGYGWFSGRAMLVGAGLALLAALLGLSMAKKKLYATFGMAVSLVVFGFLVVAPFVIRSFIRAKVAAGIYLETTQITMDTGYLAVFVGVALLIIGFLRALVAEPSFGPDDRVLKIDLLWRDTLIREMVFREKRDILAGFGRNSDFVLPFRSSRPMKLFRVDHNGDYWLALPDGMNGELNIDGERLPVSEYADREGAKVDGVSYVQVRGGDWGELQFGRTSVHFQFVRPPRVMIGRQRAMAMDGSLISSIVTSMFVVAAFYVLSQFLWNPSVEEQKKSERRTMSVEMNIIQEKDEKALSVGEGDQAAGKMDGKFGDPEVEDTQDKNKKVKKGPESDEDKQRRQMAKVQSTPILKFLGPGAGSDQAGRAMTAVAGMGDAWNMGNQMAVVQEGGSGGYGGGVGGWRGGGMAATPGTTFQKMASSDMKGTGRLAAGAGKVTVGEKTDEVAVKIRVSGNLGSQGGSGKIDRASVESVFRRRKGAIQSCYERALKVNSQVQGKVAIRFTIGPAGTVTEISVSENSTGDSQIGACITEKVRTWPFPPPDEGSVTFVYPFMLTSGG